MSKVPKESKSESLITRLPNDPYHIKVEAIAESPMRGAVPEEIDSLLKQPDKNTASLYYKTLVVHVEKLLKKGDVAGAIDAIQQSQDTNFEYKAPLNTFKRDLQNENAPYIGAHTLVGALRDAAKILYSPFYTKKETDKPAAKHFRKQIQVRPFHIFMHRNGDIIKEPDNTHGQQPTEQVKGFARYEEIESPFEFSFIIDVQPQGWFEDLLTNKEAIVKVINQSARHGLGASRGMGYGQWVPTKINFVFDTQAD